LRVALGIEYDGTNFLGWQSQTQQPTIQQTVECALTFVANELINIICAGRTDTGVHARCQVVHFDTQANRTERAWILGANSRLPSTVAVLWASQVPKTFHARYSAQARRYRYIILNRPVRPALESRFVTWERQPLNVDIMHVAAQALLGEHDFSAFRTMACQSKTPFRNIHRIQVFRQNEHVILDIQANAFLHHMVRNIAGSLVLVGRGEKPVEWIAQLLSGRDRSQAGPTAAPQGLTFIGPLYPSFPLLPSEICEESALL